MTHVSDIGPSARRAIFEALVAMAWADSRLEREEVLAVQAAGRVLELPDDVLDALDAGPPEVAHIAHEDLGEGDRELVYLCAAWMSFVDGHEDSGESSLLAELGRALGVDAARAKALTDDARLLHITVPPSVSWWEELEKLIESARGRL